MGKLQDYLNDVQDLLDNKVLTEGEMVKAFKRGMKKHLKEAEHENYCGWVTENYYRKVFTREYASRKTGEGDYTSKELKKLYKTRHTRVEVETKKAGTFFDWADENTKRPCYSNTYMLQGRGSERFTHEQLVKIYSKLK